MEMFKNTLALAGARINQLEECLKSTSNETEKLLNEKGFEETSNNLPEIISLIHCEISELCDAFKKLKGVKEEEDEIADILIRLSHIPMILGMNEHLSVCGDDMFDFINDHPILSKFIEIEENTMVRNMPTYGLITLKTLSREGNEIILLNRERYEAQSEAVGQKYNMAKFMHLITTTIDFEMMNSACMDKKLIMKLCILLAYMCDVYAMFNLNVKIEPLVKSKMEYNFTRPYKYGTPNEGEN